MEGGSNDKMSILEKREYLEDQIARIKAIIDKEGSLPIGTRCPICDTGTFERVLDHVVYDPVNKELSGLGVYFLICTACYFKVKDIWETKEEWELTATPRG